MKSKSDLGDELIREFRASGNQDNAFDKLAVERLGVNETDLHWLNIIENGRGSAPENWPHNPGLTPGCWPTSVAATSAAWRCATG